MPFGRSGPIFPYILQHIKERYNTYTRMDENRISRNQGELIPLREAAKLSGLSRSHLRKLVREGDIAGIKIGRDWLTTEKAVQEYMARDRRPGPKPPEQT